MLLFAFLGDLVSLAWRTEYVCILSSDIFCLISFLHGAFLFGFNVRLLQASQAALDLITFLPQPLGWSIPMSTYEVQHHLGSEPLAATEGLMLIRLAEVGRAAQPTVGGAIP